MPAPTSPTAHAIGGSLGSALALLLFYPLERARIELQSRAADASRRGREEDGGSKDGQDDVVVSASSSESYDMVDPQQQVSSSGIRRKSDNDSGIVSCLVDLRQRGELYRGATPVVSTLAISNYVFFYALSMMKKILASRRDGNDNSKTKSLVASSLAGIINVLLTNPLWVSNLRIVKGMKSPVRRTQEGGINQQQQQQQCTVESNLFAMMGKIAKEEGIGHLWSGTWASILLVSNPVIQYFAYDQFKAALLSRRQYQQRIIPIVPSSSRASPSFDTLSPVEAFVIGAVAKAIATVATYPIQLAQTVLRLQEKRGPEEEIRDDVANDGDKDTLRCLVRIYQEGGVAGMYQGMNAKLLQTVLTASFMFIGYEKILQIATLITN